MDMEDRICKLAGCHHFVSAHGGDLCPMHLAEALVRQAGAALVRRPEPAADAVREYRCRKCGFSWRRPSSQKPVFLCPNRGCRSRLWRRASKLLGRPRKLDPVFRGL